MTGTTTTGSIDGKLRLDIGDFLAKIELVKSEARKLGSEHPTIDVDANTSKAMASMAAVDAAAKAMGKNVSTANNQIGDSATRASARTQLIIAAVVGLTAVAAPLTAALVGVAGGLAGLGAAGVLGIIGVVQAIKQGTQAGQEWSSGLKTLKSDLSTLAGTAAAGLLGSFQRSVSMINRDMPQLNSEVAGFARILGSTAVSALQGAITAMHVLNPLFMQGAGVIQSMADGFSSWASNGGLQKFATYAQSVLPQVITTIGDLSAAILHIAEATAPIGTAVLGVLDGLATAINAIPTPALTVLAGAALTAYTTFMLFKGATAVINGVTTAAEALGTTIGGLALRAGAVGLAIGALAAVFTAVAQANAEAKARAEAYAGTLNKVTGAITDSTRALVVDNLAKAGAFNAAQKLGVGSKLLTDAVLGNKTALTSVRGAVDAHKDSLGELRGAHTETGDAARLLAGVLNLEGEGLSEAAKLARQKADAMGDSAAADQDAALTTEAATDAFWKEASAAGEVISKLNGLIDVVNTMNGVQQSAEQANARWQKDLQGIAEDAKRQADEYERVNGTLDGFTLSLDRGTAAGSANRAMLAGMAGDAQAAAKAQYDVDVRTLGAQKATENLAASLQAQKQAFIDSAVNAGYNADEVGKLADTVFRMPTKAELKFLTNAAEVTDDARKLASEILSLPGGTVTINEGDLPGVAAALADMGVDITTLPEGNVRVRKDDGTFTTVEEALNLVIRPRDAPVTASTNTGAAEAALNVASRARDTIINATANTGDAESAINYAARPRTVSLNVVTTGNQYAYAGGKYDGGGAYGGTASSGGFKGLAGGGTIRGNGSAWSDTAGLYRLAHGEEVTSNTVGQADRWRGMLKAINRNAPAGEIAGRAMQTAGVQAPAPAPVISLDGMSISGTLLIGGDGLARLVDGRIEAFDRKSARQTSMGVR